MKNKKRKSQILFSFKTEKKKKNTNRKVSLIKRIQLSSFALTCVNSLVIFTIAVIITMCGYNFLFTTGSKTAISNLAKTITDISDIKIEEYEELSNEIAKGDNVISQTIPQKISTMQESAFRVLLTIRRDIEQAYYFKDNILYEITETGTNKINENNSVYEFFKNNSDEGKISDWLYDNKSNRYLKIVPFKIDNYEVGFSYKVDESSKMFKEITDVFSNLKIGFDSNDKVLFERVNDNIYNKTLIKDKEFLSKTDLAGNKISLFDSLKENIYTIIDDFRFLDKTYDKITSRSIKADHNVTFQIGEIIDSYNLRMIEVALIILVIFIALAYIYANNIDTTKSNANIVCYVSIILLFLITFDVILRYTESYEMMRGYELLGDGLLIENNITSNYDLDGMVAIMGKDIFNERLNDSTYDYITGNMANAFKSSYNDVNKDSFNVNVEIKSNLCPESSYKYDELYEEMKKCKGQDSYIDDTLNVLHIVKYMTNAYGDNKIVVKFDLGLSKKILQLERSNNVRKPNIYIVYKNKVYNIDSQISESNKKIEYNYDKYHDTLFMKKDSSTHDMLIKESNMDYEVHLLYKIDTTSLEGIGITIISILDIAAIVLIFLLTLIKKKENEVVAVKNIYGEITYYNIEELDKKMLLTEELNKLKTQENEEVKVYISKKRRHIENDEQSEDDIDDSNLNVQNKKEKLELKQLGIFKTNKEIYQRYLSSQHDTIEQYVSNERKNIVALSEEEKTTFAKEADKILNSSNRIDGITLEEANIAYRKKKENKEDIINNKNLRASTHHVNEVDEAESDSELLSESKDEGFIKILDDKFKDTKK